jgi:hypothetical protein
MIRPVPLLPQLTTHHLQMLRLFLHLNLTLTWSQSVTLMEKKQVSPNKTFTPALTQTSMTKTQMLQ